MSYRGLAAPDRHRWPGGNGNSKRMGSIILLLAVLLAGCDPAAITTDDGFGDFRSAVLKYFTPVAEQFALRSVSESKISAEMYIEFRGPTAKLTIAHELGSGSWAYVTVTTAGGHERVFGLHTIVEAQTGSSNSFSKLTQQHDLDAHVRELADLTRKYAGSLLKERTANLRQLHLLSEKAVKERERTELGYDRASDPRPTLAQTFQACEPKVHAICAYAAVVDDNYSTEDVAAFLKVGKDEVERMITQHDTIR